MTLGDIGGAVMRGLRNVTNLHGRDTLGQYWPYALTLMGIQFMLGLLVSIPMVMQSMASSMAQVENAARAGQQASIAAIQAESFRATMVQGLQLFPYTTAISVIFGLLLIAATVRRLHDRDWSGWWVAALVVVKLAAMVNGYLAMRAIAVAMTQTHDITTMSSSMISSAALSLPIWGLYITLLVQLVQRGNGLENRFGPPPAVPGQDEFL